MNAAPGSDAALIAHVEAYAYAKGVHDNGCNFATFQIADLVAGIREWEKSAIKRAAQAGWDDAVGVWADHQDRMLKVLNSK